ncbi:hypothetical protein MKW98_007953, partial [Papaver atlanticum]
MMDRKSFIRDSYARHNCPHNLLGISIINDFKNIEGDRAMGLLLLPVAFGIDAAKWICIGAIDVTQLSVAGYLLYAGKLYYALALLFLKPLEVVALGKVPSLLPVLATSTTSILVDAAITDWIDSYFARKVF